MAQAPATHDTTKPVIPTNEARQAETPGIVRYVLGVSLAMAFVAGILLYLAYFGI
jgi:hypothetical protein